MNKARRDRLRMAIDSLSAAQMIVQQVCDKEEDCVDNYPENLHGTEVFSRMEETVSSLNDVLEKIDEARSGIADAIAV